MSTQLWQRKKCNENIIPIYLIVFNIRETFMINNVLHNECKMGLVNPNSICLHAGYCFITKFALVSWLIQLHIFFEGKGMYLVSFFYQQINSCMFVFTAIPSKGCWIKSAVTSTSFQSKISRKVFVSFWSKYSINYSSCCIISLRYQMTCSVKYNSVLQLYCYCAVILLSFT